MTREEFEAALDGLGISQTTFAMLTGLDRVTVYKWGKQGDNSRPVPTWVPVLLESWQGAPRMLRSLVRRLKRRLETEPANAVDA